MSLLVVFIHSMRLMTFVVAVLFIDNIRKDAVAYADRWDEKSQASSRSLQKIATLYIRTCGKQQ